MPYVWTPELEIGVNKVDVQHRNLLGSLNTLLSACMQGLDFEEIVIYKELFIGHMCRHFTDEEQLLLEYDVPGLTRHKLLHDSFYDAIYSFGHQLERARSIAPLQSKVHACLGDWMLTHIAREDAKLVDYMEAIARRAGLGAHKLAL